MPDVDRTESGRAGARARAPLRKMFAFGSIHQEKSWAEREREICLPRRIRKTTESELPLRDGESERKRWQRNFVLSFQTVTTLIASTGMLREKMRFHPTHNFVLVTNKATNRLDFAYS